MFRKDYKLISKFAIGFLWGLALFLCGLVFNPNSLEELLMGLMGGFLPEGEISLVNILFLILPLLIQFLLLGDSLVSDLPQAATFLFSRSVSRKKWLIHYLSILLVTSLLFYLAGITALISLGLLWGMPVLNVNGLFHIVLSLFMTAGLCQACFLLWFNILSMMWKKMSALLLLWSLYALGVFLYPFIRFPGKPFFLALYPTPQGIMTAHVVTGIGEEYADFFTGGWAFFTPVYSLLYCTLFIGLCFVYGIRKIHKHDFLN